jgi:hypothetical protein
MSKMQGLQQALKNNSGKPKVETPKTVAPPQEAAKPASNGKSPSREGKEFVGAWMNPDFATSLRMVQLRRRRDEQGKKVYLDDILAEGLNDLFRKYDVPTVHHD